MPKAKAKSPLTPFEGDPVLSATIAVTNAGDGLSKAMAVEPTELHKGDVVHVVLECEFNGVKFVPIKDTDGWQRVHVLKAGRATIIDAAVVAEALDAQQIKIEEAMGVSRLPFDATPEQKHEEHFDSGHKQPVEGCPDCEEMKAAEA